MDKLTKIPTKELAEFLGVTNAFISNVKAGRRKMPLSKVFDLSQQYGIPLHEIRPDIYPKELFNNKAG